MKRLALLLVVFCVPAAMAASGGSSEFLERFLGPLTKLEARRYDDLSIKARASLQMNEWRAVQDIAGEIYRAHADGTWKRDYFWDWIKWCEHGRRQRIITCFDLDHAISATFFDRGLELLRDSASPKLRELGRLVEEDQRPFRFHIDGVLGIAGFHRGRRFIYMNLGDVPPNEWHVTFIHELVHSVDPQLLNAAEDFRDLGRELAKMDPTKPNDFYTRRFAEPALRPKVRAWLLAGLHRGLLAEWRAWTVTFALYRDATRLGEIPRAPRLEKMLEGVSDEKLGDFTFALLDKKFVDPRSGIFTEVSVQQLLAELREELRNGKIPRTLDGLESLLTR